MLKKPSKKTIAQKQADLQQNIFGVINPNDIWHRKRSDGFTTIPRTMPLLGAIMDGLSGKGKPLSTTYLELWCRSNDDGFLTLSKPIDTAFASGFSGQRGVATWKERIRKLNNLHYLIFKPGVSGSIHYVQLWNPYMVTAYHKENNTEGLLLDKYYALLERVAEIGADDLERRFSSKSE